MISTPYSSAFVSVQQKVTRIGNCRSDYEISQVLVETTDLGDFFRKTEEEFLDVRPWPAGMISGELRRIMILEGIRREV